VAGSADWPSEPPERVMGDSATNPVSRSLAKEVLNGREINQRAAAR
jgi:hypothetical protein